MRTQQKDEASAPTPGLREVWLVIVTLDARSSFRYDVGLSVVNDGCDCHPAVALPDHYGHPNVASARPMNKLFAFPVALVVATGSSALMAIAAILLCGAPFRATRRFRRSGNRSIDRNDDPSETR